MIEIDVETIVQAAIEVCDHRPTTESPIGLQFPLHLVELLAKHGPVILAAVKMAEAMDKGTSNNWLGAVEAYCNAKETADG